ncbi:MAG: hypothetical protein ACRCZK_05110, partial [Oscillospiraceae bacterium]
MNEIIFIILCFVVPASVILIVELITRQDNKIKSYISRTVILTVHESCENVDLLMNDIALKFRKNGSISPKD